MQALKITFLLLLFPFAGNLIAQQNMGIGSATQGANSQFSIPQLYDDKLSGEKTSENVEFFAYPYVSNKIDLRDIKSRFPQLVIDNTLEIIPPDLRIFNDVAVIMAVIDQHLGSEASLIVWIAGNFESNKVTFFIDQTSDRNFLNDLAPEIIKGGYAPKKIEIYPYGKNGTSREFWLSVPKKKQRKIVSPKTKRIKKERAKMRNTLSVGVHTAVGSAKVYNEYNNFDLGFPAWYNVNLSEKQIGLSANYSFPKFRLGLTGSYQNISQYTSYFYERYAEPENYTDPNTGRRIKRENVAADPNRDIHTRHRYQLGALAAYRISLGRYVEVQPTVTAGYNYFSNGKYISNKHLEPQISFAQKSEPFAEGGLRFEFATGLYRSLFLGGTYGKMWWKPEGYFESFNGDNIQHNYTYWNFIIGYHYGF